MGALRNMKRQVQRNNPQEPPETVGLAARMADPETSGSVDPGKKRQVEDITAMFVMLMHSDQTRNSTLELLKAAPTAEEAVPPAANTMMKQVESKFQQRRQKLPNDVKVAAFTYVVSDLILLGNKAGIWERQIPQDEIGSILKETLQIYIRTGIKNKTIDPIQLQAEAEKLMTPEQKEMAMGWGQQAGIPGQPTAQMAAQQYRDEGVNKEQEKNAALQQQLQAALQQQQQNPAEQENPQGALQGPQ